MIEPLRLHILENYRRAQQDTKRLAVRSHLPHLTFRMWLIRAEVTVTMLDTSCRQVLHMQTQKIRLSVQPPLLQMCLSRPAAVAGYQWIN